MNNPASEKPAENEAAEEAANESVDTSDPVEVAKAKVRAQIQGDSAEDGMETDADGSDTPSDDPFEILKERAFALEAERDEMKDRMLRALAEAENTRRRAIRDREEAEKYGGVRLARDLLAVYDNLDRALAAAGDDVRTSAPDFIAGVELTQRELLNAFAKHQIEPVAPEVGEKFDPNRHQAMFEAEMPGAENGSIVQVMQQGFMISDRLLRAAMVGVAKNNGKSAPQPAASDDKRPDDSTSGNEDGGTAADEAQDNTQPT